MKCQKQLRSLSQQSSKLSHFLPQRPKHPRGVGCDFSLDKSAVRRGQLLVRILELEQGKPGRFELQIFHSSELRHMAAYGCIWHLNLPIFDKIHFFGFSWHHRGASPRHQITAKASLSFEKRQAENDRQRLALLNVGHDLGKKHPRNSPTARLLDVDDL